MSSQLYGNRNILGKCIKGCGWQLAHTVKPKWGFRGFTGPGNPALDASAVDEERARAWASPTRHTQKSKHSPWCLGTLFFPILPCCGGTSSATVAPCMPGVGDKAQGWRDAGQGQATGERGTGAGGEVTR